MPDAEDIRKGDDQRRPPPEGQEAIGGDATKPAGTPGEPEVLWVAELVEDAAGDDDIPYAQVLPSSPPHPGFWWAVLWCLGILIVTQLLPGIVAGIVLVARGVSLERLQDTQALLNSPEYADAMLVAFVLAEALSIAMALLALCLVVGRSWPRLLGLRWPSWYHLVLAPLGLPGLMVVAMGIDALAKQALPSLLDLEEMTMLFGKWPWPLGVLIIGIGPGIAEELWFRGFFGRGLVARYGVIGGVLLTSLLFAMIHIEPRQVAYGVFVGALLHLAYLASRSLLVPILMHAINNSLAVLGTHVEGLEAVDVPPEHIPWPVYAVGVVVVAAVGWAFYRSRTSLIDVDDAGARGWRPEFAGVEHPPPRSATRLGRQAPDLVAWLLAVGSVVAFVAVLAPFAGDLEARAQEAHAARKRRQEVATLPRDWKMFTSAPCGFSVGFPKNPAHAAQPSATTPRTIHEFKVDDGRTSYTVLWFDPPGLRHSAYLFQEMKTVRANYPLGRIDPEESVTCGSYHGWQFTIRFADRTIVRRSYHRAGRDYMLEVSTSRPYVQIAAEARAFFESFRPVDWDKPEADPGPVTPRAVRVLKGAETELVAVAFSRDGQTLTAVAHNGQCCAWDVASGELTRRVAFAEPRLRLLTCTLAPDGELGAASALAGQFFLFDPAEARTTAVLVERLTPEIAWSAAFSPDGKYVAAGHGNALIKRWDVAQQAARHLEVNERVNSVAFTPDGKTLAAGTTKNQVTLWDAATGTRIAVLQGSPGKHIAAGAVWALAYSPDGKTLAAGGNDRTVRLWDVDSRKEVAVLNHGDTVRSVAFARDGRLLASGDDAGHVAVWDSTGEPRATFPPENGVHSVRALAFSPDGTLLVATVGNQVRLWRLPR